jgi:geranyl-CoA carboxylase alpha subunit
MSGKIGAARPPLAPRKLLIANRGEIALRIARTARSLGYRTVAVYSDADRGAPHVEACDEAVHVGEAPAAASYLSIERIVAAAVRSGADAVHPGYGFLSENASFAEACGANGLIFVGPPPEGIRAMGNKSAAKARMLAAGVPCIPGFAGEQAAGAFAAGAHMIGYPVMLKAAAGGGGKGMRVARNEIELEAAFETTRLEAERAFGSGELLLEKALERSRHIEIQIFADAHGAIVHLGERDCSIQRRHQKIIEEAPSPAVGAELREAMGEAAIAAARAVGYVGAGTIEFLLDDDGAFYFLEMNTRLQVEHAVTEATRGIDLVAWQLRVAAGDRLSTIAPNGTIAAGHAIEARLYAEDPAHGFLPQAGTIAMWRPPAGDGIRIDAALRDGLAVSPYYDPMLAKIVAFGADRAEARRRLVRALEDLTLLGIATNRTFLLDCLERETFVSGEAHTDFVAALADTSASHGAAASSDAALALGAVLFHSREHGGRGWQSRPGASTRLTLLQGDRSAKVAVTNGEGAAYAVSLPSSGGPIEIEIEIVANDGERARFIYEGVLRSAAFAWAGDTLYLQVGRADFTIVDATLAPSAQHASAERGPVTSPMPGIVAKVSVAVGDDVVLGQTLVVLEAMKMLHEVSAGATGRIANILVAPGQQVGMRALLVEIVPDARSKMRGNEVAP